MAAGALTISIDLELAWGVCDRPLTAQQRDALGRERAIVQRLLELFAAYDVRATWAVVGHLLATECPWAGTQVHPEIARWTHDGMPADWFFQHPPQDQTDDPLWYGRDLMSMIQHADPPQEFGSHSFCHVPYDERRVPRDTVWADLSAARALHRTHGLPFESFVFPRNVVGYQALLQAAGIAVYRGTTPRWYDRIPSRPVRRAFRLAAYAMPTCPPTVRPDIDAAGLVNIPDSLLLIGRQGLRGLIPPAVSRRKGYLALERAASRGEVFHLWFHPSNFTEQPEVPFGLLEAWLERARTLRAQGRLRVMTMGDYARSATQAVEHIRRQAVAAHETGVEQFTEWYEEMAVDPYASAFAYGRLEVIACLRGALGDLPRASRILDVGCGTGDQVQLLSRWGFQVQGVEPSAGMRRVAQQRNPGRNIQDGLIGSLPFADATFDAVIAIEVLRYLHRQDILAAYRELLRVLKPGGRMFFTMVNRYALDGFAVYDWIRKRLRAAGPSAGQAAHCEFVTPRQVLRDLADAGGVEAAVQGRLILPTRVLYKLHEGLGARCARLVHPVDRWLAARPQAAPFSGHLIVVAQRPVQTTQAGRIVHEVNTFPARRNLS